MFELVRMMMMMYDDVCMCKDLRFLERYSVCREGSAARILHGRLEKQSRVLSLLPKFSV